MCPQLRAPEHGSVEQSGNHVGATGVFSCDDGYTLNGKESLKCGPGRWSNPVPTCSFGESLDATFARVPASIPLPVSLLHDTVCSLVHCSTGCAFPLFMSRILQ